MTKEIVALDQLAVEIRFYSQQTAQNILEVGTRLIAAKKQVESGQWEEWLKGQVGYTIRTAQRFMKCAERFNNASMSSLLTPSQMFELLSLPADETETFIEQKKAEGNPVEDMTVKALRQEVKEYKDKLAAQEKEMKRQQKYHDEMMDIMNEKEKVIKEEHEEQLDEKNGMIESLQAGYTYRGI